MSPCRLHAVSAAPAGPLNLYLSYRTTVCTPCPRARVGTIAAGSQYILGLDLQTSAPASAAASSELLGTVTALLM